MKKISVDELKKIEIEILDFVTNFCDKNNINYWLDSGTLLGAIRHKGYIPWDDDIDIGMLRDDYDKFIKLFSQNDEYKLMCYENDKNWPFPFGKVLKKGTELYEPNKEMGIKLGVYIDIFVYDNAPSNARKLKKMYFLRDFYFRLNVAQLFNKSIIKTNKLYNFSRKIIHAFLSFFPRGYFVKKVIKNSKKYSKKQTTHVGNFMAVSKIYGDKSIFDEFILVEFEGKKYKAPKGYDEWLTEFYGNYMELPPIEKRKSQHMFEAYTLN